MLNLAPGQTDRRPYPTVSSAELADCYRAMWRIRRVEQEIERLYPTDKIKSPVHLSVGQEPAAVGLCGALRKDDILFATYRGHAAYLAKGGDLKRMVAELYGKETGCGEGRSGSMHLIDLSVGMMGTSAIVATSIPNAVGYAWAMKFAKSDRVVVSVFGDGATEEGVFHESLNFAALKKLPVLFVCENNLYAIHSHIKDRLSNLDFCERARAYGVPAERVQADDVFGLRHTVEDTVAAIRAGGGPRFIELETYRFSRHVGPGDDRAIGYRTQAEVDHWRTLDAVERVGAQLTNSQRTEIETEVEAEVLAAFAFAEASAFPDGSELLEHVFNG